jgi:enediyne biosynthesis protein E3
LAVLDYFSPWQQRLITFLEGPAQAHNYMLHVGAGWTVGILPRSYKRLLKQLDPLLGWLAIDGYGFQQGFFAWQRSIEQQKQPSRLSGYARRAFDQGLGRSLWFVKCADAAQITATIGTFPAERQGDLWSGIGLACAYAGGAPHSCIEALATNSGAYYPHLAQGVAFAIKARHKAGNIVQHTELACQSILQAQIDEVVALVDDALAHLPPNDQSYEIWRSRIQDRFATRSRQHYQEHPSFTGPF